MQNNYRDTKHIKTDGKLKTQTTIKRRRTTTKIHAQQLQRDKIKLKVLIYTKRLKKTAETKNNFKETQNKLKHRTSQRHNSKRHVATKEKQLQRDKMTLKVVMNTKRHKTSAEMQNDYKDTHNHYERQNSYRKMLNHNKD